MINNIFKQIQANRMISVHWEWRTTEECVVPDLQLAMSRFLLVLHLSSLLSFPVLCWVW